ncbi:RagB/SusD family nutrient uptake outer membrane protein [Pedobacter sp. SYSU D00535]|uniref:RagB/SusD family nutrient uptake outer membrane protein n=1 Tax=Pedobacter sp. SYSU D00535 TaxID=2810308 RepID=UPI001A96F7F4|nr:RagB/SusD family nutrient uptake outer membrane protein [Pedobacter sp. SYSU D00535]
MKKLLSILILSCVFFAGCSDFLEEDNKSGITNDEFYKTASGFESLMTASYSGLRNIFGRDGDNAPYVYFAGTDMYESTRNTNADRGILTYNGLFPSDARVTSFYTAVYANIQNVNLGLAYVDAAEISDALKKQYKAELTCLRAILHFWLIEQFGGVVLHTQATQSAITSIPRSSLADSYNFVISEMESQVANLSDNNKRLGKEAGYHYLAKMYLTRGWDLNDQASFTKAKENATKAINGKGITIPFETLWSPTNENNAEFLFSVQYDVASLPSVTEGNSQQSLFGSYLGGTETGLGKYQATTVYPSWSLQSFYPFNDKRYEGTFMTIIYNNYYDYYNPADTATKAIYAFYPRGNGADFSSADSIAWVTKNASRLKRNPNGSLAFRMRPFKSNERAYRWAWSQDFYGPVIKKFDSPATKATFSIRASARDIVLARRAETYFLYAEACIGLNQFGEAQTYLETVTRRPGNSKNGTPLVPVTNIANLTSQSAALDSYLIESAKEFAGEFLRWPELRRTKKLKEFVGRYNWDIRVDNGGAEAVLPGDVAKRYRPIPQAAIDRNDALTEADQNPGY